MSSSSSIRRAYNGSHTSSATSSENLPPRMLAKVAREIRDLHKNPPEGVRLIVDPETGCPDNLAEIMVSLFRSKEEISMLTSRARNLLNAFIHL